MLSLALLAALPSAPQPAAVKLFGDWAVACDNVRRCEMTSLLPEDEMGGDDAAMVSIVRAAGPDGGFEVEIASYGEIAGALALRIDDAAVATHAAKENVVTFTGADAGRIVAAIANGNALTLTDASGKPVAHASLKGSSAALRFIDAEQGRAGTVTAAVARGAKPASAVPAPPAAPKVPAFRPAGTPATVSPAMRAAMEKASECAGMYEGIEGGPPPVETHALGGGKTLALLPCGAGAYNFSTVAFVIAGGQWTPAGFDHAPDQPEQGPLMLVNADWDADKALLSTYAKGRGLGDCGASASYAWDGTRFRLVEAREMPECRGSVNWLRTFVAEPAPR